MTLFPKRKRKNDEPRPFTAWIIVLFALALVIVAAILFQSNSRSTSDSVVNQPLGNIELTATYIIQQATSLAQGTPQPDVAPSKNDLLDPIALTATYVVGQATAMAQGTPQPGVVSPKNDNIDPLLMTATALIQSATEQAGTPNA